MGLDVVNPFTPKESSIDEKKCLALRDRVKSISNKLY